MVGVQIWQKLPTRKRNKIEDNSCFEQLDVLSGGLVASPRVWKSFMET
jgi:hypothetical protein